MYGWVSKGESGILGLFLSQQYKRFILPDILVDCLMYKTHLMPRLYHWIVLDSSLCREQLGKQPNLHVSED